jgi:hypothetical protein
MLMDGLVQTAWWGVWAMVWVRKVSFPGSVGLQDGPRRFVAGV